MRAALTLPLIAVLALTGCVAEPPVVLPSEQASISPVFASEEEALAAAGEAYGAYLAASDQVLAEGGGNPEPLTQMLSDSLSDETLDGIALYVDRGWRTQGKTEYDNVQLQQYIEEGDGLATVVVYLCTDVTGVRIIDSSGQDVTPSRDDRLPIEVEVAFQKADSSSPTIVRSEVWTGDDFCG